MTEYRVVWTGTVREIYYVEAENEDEARQKWSDDEPFMSEAQGGEVTSIEVADDDD